MTVSTSALRKGAPPARTTKTQSPIDTDPRPAEAKNRGTATDGPTGRIRRFQRPRRPGGSATGRAP